MHDAMPQKLSQIPFRPVCALDVGTCLQKEPGFCHKGFFQCTAGLTKELLHGLPTGSPNSKLLDYWATLSSCLTDLSFLVDPADKQLLQPTYLNQLNHLTKLTRLAFGESDPSRDWTEVFHYALELPELKVLCIKSLGASNLQLQCPQLKILRIESFIIRKLHLQASLERLHLAEGGDFSIHEGFPIANLIGLTYLSLHVSYDIVKEAALFQGLTLMTQLRILDMGINMCSLPATLPSSLQDVTLSFSYNRAWDSSVIPLVQQLPEAQSIRILPRCILQSLGDKSLDHDLRPFLAMKPLKFLQLGYRGTSHMWKASALRQLEELEAEVLRLGKTFKLMF